MKINHDDDDDDENIRINRKRWGSCTDLILKK
jgi:hypothetical protein